jgi:hypothetical protein
LAQAGHQLTREWIDDEDSSALWFTAWARTPVQPPPDAPRVTPSR